MAAAAVVAGTRFVCGFGKIVWSDKTKWLWHSTWMIKRICGTLLLGLVIALGCSKEVMRDQANASAPQTNSPPIDLHGAIAQAKTENKLVLLDFTGSDWCPPCMELEKTVFSQPQFQTYAASNLVFLTVDFPQKFQLSPAATATNNWLSDKFNIEGTPTLIALDGTGRIVWKHLGMLDGGPKALIADLDAAKSQAK